MPDIFVDHPTNQDTQKQKAPSAAAKSVQALLEKPTKAMGVFAAYCLRPSGVSFVNQEDDETILLFLRRHFITNVPWLASTILLLLIPPLLYLLILLASIPIPAIPSGLIIVIITFYYLILIGYAFGNFISWFYNIGIVTQKRIMDLDSSNILTHNTTTANLSEVVDVKFIQQGFFQSFFNYGDVHIQTEALRANFDFSAAPNPTQVEDIISDLRVSIGGSDDANS